MKPTVFGTDRPSRTTDMRENVPPKPVFRVSVRRYEVFRRKNLKKVFGIPFPIQKVIFIFVIQRPIPLKMVIHPKIIFRSYSEKDCFFRKKLLHENIQNHNIYKKCYIEFCRQMPPFPQNCPPTNGFSHFPQEILLFTKNLFNNKISVT